VSTTSEQASVEVRINCEDTVSRDSHLPEEIEQLTVTGLGMNADELAQNPRLHSRVPSRTRYLQ